MDLRSWRKAKGLGLKDLVGPLGCSIAQLSRIEQGHSDPTREFMRKAFDFTEGQVTPNDFVERGDRSEAPSAGAAA